MGGRVGGAEAVSGRSQQVDGRGWSTCWFAVLHTLSSRRQISTILVTSLIPPLFCTCPQATAEGGRVAGVPGGAGESEGGVEGGEGAAGGGGGAAAGETGDCEETDGGSQRQLPGGTEGPGGGEQVRRVAGKSEY